VKKRTDPTIDTTELQLAVELSHREKKALKACGETSSRAPLLIFWKPRNQGQIPKEERVVIDSQMDAIIERFHALLTQTLNSTREDRIPNFAKGE
jgi:hypothetical protein